MIPDHVGGSVPVAGAWIGIDVGTTNCAAAVYDRTRGGSKWMRLSNISVLEEHKILGNKVGRIVPSTVVLATHQFVVEAAAEKNDTSTDGLWQDISSLITTQQDNPYIRLYACVGGAVERMIDEQEKRKMNALQTKDEGVLSMEEKIESATIRNFKRKLLVTSEISTNNQENNIIESESLSISVKPLGMNQSVIISAKDVLSILLYCIRLASDQYLSFRTIRKKHLDIPGNMPPCIHASLGVPAAATQKYRQLLSQAAAKAGFIGTVATTTESTAAAMAYGLFVKNTNIDSSNNEQQQTILVFDMGGGTTDVTIAQQQRQNNQRATADDITDFKVMATVGNNQLGGNDMDEALLLIVKQKIPTDVRIMSPSALLQQCKRAKEQLSGDGRPGGIPPASTAIIKVAVESLDINKTATSSNTWTITLKLTQDDLIAATKPIVQKAREVVRKAVEAYCSKLMQQKQHVKPDLIHNRDDQIVIIHEIILVGGASRVPAIREMLREQQLQKQIIVVPPSESEEFHVDRLNHYYQFQNELCLSIHPMSAVAQGCAVHAALTSHTIPWHELKSSLMLDTCPHPIGVLVENVDDPCRSLFVEIIAKDSTLPAANYATFYLADIHQPGVTVKAVEEIQPSGPGSDSATQFNVMGEFTFLLHRLSPEQLASASLAHGGRSVDIGMTLKENGEFVVSIFDPNDPEHLRKRDRCVREAHLRDECNRLIGDVKKRKLEYNDAALIADEPITNEQIALLFACVIIFLLYVIVKVSFAKPEDFLNEEAFITSGLTDIDNTHQQDKIHTEL